MTTSPSQEQALPSHYRSKQAFLSSLPWWRQLLQRLNWHPTVELKVQRYELEQRLKRLDEVEQRLDALWPSSNSSTTQPQPPASDSGT